LRLALFDFRQAVDYRLEILSGLTVAMALIPVAVAFALIAGLSPLTGLYAAFIVGLVASVLGGRPGMISGATGAVAALVFAWDNAVRIRARKRMDDQGWKHYELYGPLFFGSTTVFAEKFDVEGHPEDVVLDFRESRVVDMSAIEALNRLTAR
jgi:SulP family sulfate permease